MFFFVSAEVPILSQLVWSVQLNTIYTYDFREPNRERSSGRFTSNAKYMT
jgi:hypothetical protein